MAPRHFGDGRGMDVTADRPSVKGLAWLLTDLYREVLLVQHRLSGG